MKHGTISAYTNHGCRCDECCAANTNWKKLYVCGLVEKRQRKHGTMSMYNTGCRCPQCVAECRAYSRARYQKLKQVA